MEKKDRIQLSISGVLIIVLFILLARAVGGKRQQQPVLVEHAVSPTRVAVPERRREKSLYARLAEETKDLEFKRDPFLKLPMITSESSQGLYLSGILWDEVKPTAIINDEIVAVGSQIQGKRVIEILKNKVILEEDGLHIELILE